jgi:hypothetical protein
MSGIQLWAAFAVVMSFGVLLLGLIPLFITVRRYGKAGRPPVGYTVTIEGGPGGAVTYEEGADRHRFNWELSAAGNVILFVYVPAYADWAEKVPWPIERREEILDRVAAEVKRQRCRTCRSEVGETMIQFFEW